ncbi:tRNA (adenosine(37)-N6)-threonylcarbamoyltransferase complex dimerization subunit type 1 TsaB [Aurantibacillus circumpalustris]|uniref:tRNA (adenosine(37)-N6)-threonylcarbamoyltransferase complex dimerization subunit type 1 TsaB n=1 Tax=Aurantibacillus circumpalustris TaxID=3036359 RepID=UPI00295BDE51|nr:tRNA (adenosine(37)-N6)-threonylcarbamoyltransferase complex dimerization subunit type 1 TsaB [Aurantibacillus circumpalustris]
MAYILNIETATTVCSVSISENEKVLFFKEINEGFTHAENLHLFIQEALKSCNLLPSQLNAVSVSKGPGSYTGLRIGVSAAKGLAYALNIPLIGLSTLQIMANAAYIKQQEPGLYCPMIDARRMEVYTALYSDDLKLLSPIEALILNESSVLKFASHPKVFYFGDGMSKCKALLNQIENSRFIEGINPSVEHISQLVFNRFKEKEFEELAYFEPFYLKDFMILKKKSSI